MGVGPPERTGRDQLTAIKQFVTAHRPGSQDVVVVACNRGAGGVAARATVDGSPVFGWNCAGSVHTSVVEYLVRSGVAGVLVVACPVRDCWNREGPKWLEQRMYHDREAELKERVDRRRVRLRYASEGERETVRAELHVFREDLTKLKGPTPEPDIELDLECDPVPDEEAVA